MSELDKVHRFGIAGAGTIGAFHAAAIAILPAAQLVAVTDVRPGAAGDWPPGTAARPSRTWMPC